MKEQSSLSIEELFKRSWKAFWLNWKTFIGISLIWWLVFASLLFLFKIYPLQSILSYFGLASLYLALSLISLWIMLSLIIVVRDWKEKIGIRKSFKKSQSKIFDFFIVGLLTYLMILVGFLLLVLPGIMFWIYLSLVPFVLVCENIKGKAVLKRSWGLIKGHWWEVFAKLLMLMIVIFVVSWIASLGLSMVSFIFKIFIFPLKWLLPVLYEVMSGAVGFISKSLPSLITFPFSLIYTYFIYKDLKRIKEKS